MKQRNLRDERYLFYQKARTLTQSETTQKSKPLLFDIDPKVFFALNYERYNIYFRNHVSIDTLTLTQDVRVSN